MEKRGISRGNGRRKTGDTPSPARGGDRRSGQAYFDTLPSAMRELRNLYNEVRSGRVGKAVYRVNMQVGILRVWMDARKFIETMQMKTSDAELVRRVAQLEEVISDLEQRLAERGLADPRVQ